MGFLNTHQSRTKTMALILNASSIPKYNRLISLPYFFYGILFLPIFTKNIGQNA
jgi:hypothetical protein